MLLIGDLLALFKKCVGMQVPAKEHSMLSGLWCLAQKSEFESGMFQHGPSFSSRAKRGEHVLRVLG